MACFNIWTVAQVVSFLNSSSTFDGELKKQTNLQILARFTEVWVHGWIGEFIKPVGTTDIYWKCNLDALGNQEAVTVLSTHPLMSTIAQWEIVLYVQAEWESMVQ